MRRYTTSPLGFWIVALLSLATDSVRGAVVVTDPDGFIPVMGSGFPPVPFDLDGDGVDDLSLRIGGFQAWSDSLGATRILGFEQFINFFSAVANPSGAFIGGTPPLGTEWRSEELSMVACSMGICSGEFDGGIAYLGVEFEISGATHYGWLEIESASQFTQVLVHRWAYESEPGIGIVAGVPEPGSGLLVLLSIALAFFRRRRTVGVAC